MKIAYKPITLCFVIVLASFFYWNPVSAFWEGPWSNCPGEARALQVVPHVKIGYQRVTVNLNVPIGGLDPFGIVLGDMDITTDKQDFLIWALGMNTVVGKRLEVFAEASISAEGTASVTTNFTNRIVAALPTSPTGWSWPTQRVRWWEVNFGGSLNLGDYAAVLLGYKFDRLSQRLTNPNNAYRWPAGTFQDHNGDLDIRTWSPYIGLRFDDRRWRFDLIWSPFLTSCVADMPLVLAWADAAHHWTSPQNYRLSGGGGNLLEVYGEGKFNIIHLLAAKLWLNAGWLNCRRSGNRDYSLAEDTAFLPSRSGSASADCRLTRYLWALGVLGEIKF